jgi:zinc D-Ala-D-Ala dipeptidase
MRPPLTLALVLLALPAAARELPAGFVYLREVAPTIAQDIRYASPNNFTAAALPGYGAAECVLRREAAEALSRVQADLAAQKLGLKVYDCYRPERAVRAMWHWAHDGGRDGDKHFFPNTNKQELFSLGYIAARSRHSAGIAVDLTLIPQPASRPVMDRPSPGGDCTASAAQRPFDTSLDMGTGFDCLNAKSYTRSNAVSPDQRRARETLRAAMSAHGFRNYFREWWHYEFTGPGEPRGYDFVIEPK